MEIKREKRQKRGKGQKKEEKSSGGKENKTEWAWEKLWDYEEKDVAVGYLQKRKEKDAIWS